VYTVSQIIGIIAIVTVAAHKRFTGFIAKHTFPVAALMELALVLSGICTYRNIFSICLIVGAFCQTTSFWLIDEKVIGPVCKYLEESGEDFSILVLPDHPTPISTGTQFGS